MEQRQKIVSQRIHKLFRNGHQK